MPFSSKQLVAIGRKNGQGSTTIAMVHEGLFKPFLVRNCCRFFAATCPIGLDLAQS